MAHDATEHHTRVLADFLCKEAEKDPETNLEESTVGVNPDQQPDPGGHASGDIDASWGERTAPKGGTQNSMHFSDSVLQSVEQSRHRMLNDLFASKGPAAKAEKSLVAQQLDHGSSGNFESSSCLLGKHSSDSTLLELTRGILD